MKRIRFKTPQDLTPDYAEQILTFLEWMTRKCKGCVYGSKTVCETCPAFTAKGILEGLKMSKQTLIVKAIDKE